MAPRFLAGNGVLLLATIAIGACSYDHVVAEPVDAAASPDLARERPRSQPADSGPAPAARDAPAATQLDARAGVDGDPVDAPADAGVGSDVATTTLGDGLVGHWKLDDGQGMVARDESVNLNHGTLAPAPSTPVWTAQGARPGSGALVFDGVDDMCTLGTTMIPAVEAPKSVSMWVRWEAVPADGGRHSFIAIFSDGAMAGIHLGFRDFRVAVWNYRNDEIVGTPPPPPGWHHLGYTFDGMTHRLYVDGAPVADGAMGTQTGRVAVIRLGSSNAAASQPFAGSIDDVRIFGRALSAAEVALLRMQP